MSLLTSYRLVAIRALLAVLFCALTVGLIYFLNEIASAPRDSAALWPGFATFFSATFIIGAAAVILVGAPAYVWLIRHGKATWPLVIALGAWPSAIAFASEGALFGLVVALCGIFVAASTHVLCARVPDLSAGSNKSLQRTRGAGFGEQ